MIRYEDFFRLLSETLAQVDDELAKRTIQGPNTPLQTELALISTELHELMRILESNQLPPIADRKLRSARIAILYFPMDEALSEKICKLGVLYEQGLFMPLEKKSNE